MNKIPKLRFPEFNGEWEEKRFGDLVRLQRGSSPRPIIKFVTTSEEGVNWIKIGDTNKNKTFITSTKEKITKEGALKSRKVNIGDIILSNSMSFGRPFILAIDGYIHDGWFVIREYEKNFNKEYLCQLLGADIVQKQYKTLAAGGVVDNISSELVNAVEVNIPSLPEQEEIASFLSSVDSKIEKLERKKELWEQYKKGMMQKIFSQELRFKNENGEDYPEWEEKSLGEVCEIIMGQSPSSLAYNENLEGLPLIQGNADCKNRKVIPRVYTSEITKTSENGDIIMSVRAPAGTVAISNIRSCIGRGVCAIRKKTTNQEYIFQYLINYEKEWSKYSQGSTFDSINSNDVKELIIPLPSLPEQTQIADFLSSIDSKIEIVEKELLGMREFKKGLLQKMFV